MHVLLIGKDFDIVPSRQEHVNESPRPSIQIPPFMQRDSSVVLHTASSVSQNKPSDKMKFVEMSSVQPTTWMSILILSS